MDADIDVLIGKLADRQHGIVRHAQLLAMGLSRRAIEWRLAHGRLIRLYTGVYAVGHRALRPRGYLIAAVFACGPSAVLSHKSAAAMWELLSTDQTRVDVTVPGTSRAKRRGIRVHRTRSLHADEITEVDGISVTTVARTTVDLCGVLNPHQVLKLIEQADRSHVLDVLALQRVISRCPNRKGLGTLRRVLSDYTGPPAIRSDLERRFVALITEAGLPMPLLNVPLAGYTVDAYWPQWRLVVELDGRGYHLGPRQFETDRIRDAALQRIRCRVLRVTDKRMTSSPAAVIDDVRVLAALAA
jgi:hypothetical protein